MRAITRGRACEDKHISELKLQTKKRPLGPYVGEAHSLRKDAKRRCEGKKDVVNICKSY